MFRPDLSRINPELSVSACSVHFLSPFVKHWRCFRMNLAICLVQVGRHSTPPGLLQGRGGSKEEQDKMVCSRRDLDSTTIAAPSSRLYVLDCKNDINPLHGIYVIHWKATVAKILRPPENDAVSDWWARRGGMTIARFVQRNKMAKLFQHAALASICSQQLHYAAPSHYEL